MPKRARETASASTPSQGPMIKRCNSSGGRSNRKQKSPTRNTASPTASPDPADAAKNKREVRNLTGEYDIKTGSRIEVLFTIEIERIGASKLDYKKIWWPATVLEPTTNKTVTIKAEDGAEDGDVLVALTPIRYDPNGHYPEWNTDEDLSSAVAFIHQHALMENTEGKAALWRKEGTGWTVNKMRSMAPGEAPKTEEAYPEAIADQIIISLAIPFFEENVHRIPHRTQQEFFVQKVVMAKNEFVRILKQKNREQPGYLACLTDEMLLEVLKMVGRNVEERTATAGH
eukprot:g7220.t1